MKMWRLLLACGLVATPVAATSFGPFMIFFRTGQASVRREARFILDNAALAMNSAPEAHAIVAGHAYREGSARRMRALSCGRARAAQAYLVSRGIAPERMTPVGYGDDLPMHDYEGPQEHRRAELLFMARDQVDEQAAGATRC